MWCDVLPKKEGQSSATHVLRTGESRIVLSGHESLVPFSVGSCLPFVVTGVDLQHLQVIPASCLHFVHWNHWVTDIEMVYRVLDLRFLVHLMHLPAHKQSSKQSKQSRKTKRLAKPRNEPNSAEKFESFTLSDLWNVFACLTRNFAGLEYFWFLVMLFLRSCPC